MITSTVQGDLISFAKEGKYDVIVHGCNCFHTFGAGIARQIKKEFPRAFEADKTTEYSDFKKIGTYSMSNEEFPIIINAYTQYHFGGKRPVYYTAIKDVFTLLNNEFRGTPYKIGIPKIGAGLAGGDWNTIKDIINEVTPDLNIELVEYKVVLQ